MVKVVQRGRIRIYVYEEIGHRHHLAHCHVYWPDGAAIFGLDQIEQLAGAIPPATAAELLHDHLDELRAAWDHLNPKDRP